MTEKTEKTTQYVVKEGDTVVSIAEKFSMDPKFLLDINGKKVTYADIRVDYHNEPFIAECIGIYSGNEFWTIFETS